MVEEKRGEPLWWFNNLWAAKHHHVAFSFLFLRRTLRENTMKKIYISWVEIRSLMNGGKKKKKKEENLF